MKAERIAEIEKRCIKDLSADTDAAELIDGAKKLRADCDHLERRNEKLRAANAKALGRIRDAQSASSTPLNLLGTVGILEAALADTVEDFNDDAPAVRFDAAEVARENERQEAEIMRLRRALSQIRGCIYPELRPGHVANIARKMDAIADDALADTAEEPSR